MEGIYRSKHQIRRNTLLHVIEDTNCRFSSCYCLFLRPSRSRALSSVATDLCLYAALLRSWRACIRNQLHTIGRYDGTRYQISLWQIKPLVFDGEAGSQSSVIPWATWRRRMISLTPLYIFCSALTCIWTVQFYSALTIPRLLIIKQLFPPL